MVQIASIYVNNFMILEAIIIGVKTICISVTELRSRGGYIIDDKRTIPISGLGTLETNKFELNERSMASC
jgi:hypothetical protein